MITEVKTVNTIAQGYNVKKQEEKMLSISLGAHPSPILRPCASESDNVQNPNSGRGYVSQAR